MYFATWVRVGCLSLRYGRGRGRDLNLIVVGHSPDIRGLGRWGCSSREGQGGCTCFDSITLSN